MKEEMKEVILHIGLHKTGTTSIQRALKGYNKNGVKAIGFEEKNHSIPMYTIFSESRYKYHIWQKRNYSRGDIEKKRNDYLEILTSECSNNEIKTLIISGEDLSVLDNSEVKILAKFFRMQKVKTTIICYVRDPLSWISSASQERVKAGWPVAKIDEIFKRPLQNYMQHFGKENIQVFDFQKSINLQNSIVLHFSKTLSIDLKDPPKANESLNSVQFALIQILNGITNGIAKHTARDVVVNKIRKLSSTLPSKNTEKLDKQQFENFISSGNSEECNWLKQEFGICYQIPENTGETNLDHYVEKTLRNSLGTINALFLDIGTFYNPLISLHDNFLNAYIFLETGINHFDPSLYLELNPDVKAAGVDPYRHYLEHGIKEGRRIPWGSVV